MQYGFYNRMQKTDVIQGLLVHYAAHSAEEGARRIVHGAIHGSHKLLQGQYLSDYKVSPTSHFVRSQESKVLEDRVWVRCFLDILPFFSIL